MKYTINYNEQGKILGFTQGKDGLNIEVSNATYVEAMKYNKIIVDGDNISFDKVDWRTEAEKTQQQIDSIQSQLEAIDAWYHSDRSWREHVISNPDQFSTQAVDRMQQAETEAQALRDELAGLT